MSVPLLVAALAVASAPSVPVAGPPTPASPIVAAGSSTLASPLLAAGSATTAEATQTPPFFAQFGAGAGYALLGANVGLSFGHVELFLGLGVLTAAGGGMAGGRYIQEPGGSGLMLTLAGGHLFSGSGTDFPKDAFAVSLLGGYRAAISKTLYIDMAAGPMTLVEQRPGDTALRVFPDVDLGIGLRF